LDRIRKLADNWFWKGETGWAFLWQCKIWSNKMRVHSAMLFEIIPSIVKQR
jgi:hypothetical protein